MVKSSNKVALVVDPNYGQRLLDLVGTGAAVWIIDTETNRTAAKSYWSLNLHAKPEYLTIFNYSVDHTATETCLTILPVVDLHHGESSSGYSFLEIIGVKLNKRLRSAVTELGFRVFVKTAEGFRASRE